VLEANDMTTIKQYYCDACDKDVLTEVIKRSEVLPVKGERVDVEASVRVCRTCGGDISDESLDGETLEKAYRIYRVRHGLLGPAEIRRLREKYGMSQRSLSILLDWGEVTIHRYENGSLPDAAHNQVLTFLEDPSNMRKVFLQNKDRLSREAQRVVLEHLNSLDVAEFLREILGSKTPEQWSSQWDASFQYPLEQSGRLSPRELQMPRASQWSVDNIFNNLYEEDSPRGATEDFFERIAA
jgi:putative zinc finger/helix-turn-helix YgiT family protein